MSNRCEKIKTGMCSLSKNFAELSFERGHCRMRLAISDTLPKLIKGAKEAIGAQTKNVKEVIPGDSIYKYDSVKLKTKMSSKMPELKVGLPDGLPALKSANPLKTYFSTQPLLGSVTGTIGYYLNYRSAIDTPFTEKDIAQHIITGRTDFEVKGLPLELTYLIRKSNSAFFRDLADVRLAFNPFAFSNKFRQHLLGNLDGFSSVIIDSISGSLYLKKLEELKSLQSMLNGGRRRQELVEAYGIINVPSLSLNRKNSQDGTDLNSDSLKNIARNLLKIDSLQKKYQGSLNREVDSLKKVYNKSVKTYNEFRKLLGPGAQDASHSRLKSLVADNPGLNSLIPKRYLWLLNLRALSVGKTPLNYSELTAKNISVNGVNFEYNSWYYVAVAAGLVDYRFRDFVVGSNKQTPQPLYLVRLGIGRVESNNIIVTGFSGTKQLYASDQSGSGISSIKISGVSLSSKLLISRSSYLSGEIAQSISPDYRSDPPKTNTTLSVLNWTNAAFSLKMYSFIPKTRTLFEGNFKKNGANYQSFSSFQTNAAVNTWYLKADQSFFKRKLRLNASLRTNDYSNPYIPQNYKSNTVFKSLTATFKARKLPIFSFGYQPMSQLTVLDSITVENRFQTVTASIHHQYRIKHIQTNSSLIYNKFFNTGADSALYYFNASNILFSQQFFFSGFSTSLGVSQIKSAAYSLLVLDESFQLAITKASTIGFGFKINNLDNSSPKVGASISTVLRVNRADIIYFSYESGYLPGSHGGLIHTQMGSVQFTKSFGFNTGR